METSFAIQELLLMNYVLYVEYVYACMNITYFTILYSSLQYFINI